MYEKLMFLWRHLAQVAVGAVVAWLVGRGVGVDPAAASAIEAAAFGLGVWAYGVAVRWLETRPGDTIAAKAARAVARLLMLGAPPTLTYVRPEPNAVTALKARSTSN